MCRTLTALLTKVNQLRKGTLSGRFTVAATQLEDPTLCEGAEELGGGVQQRGGHSVPRPLFWAHRSTGMALLPEVARALTARAHLPKRGRGS